MVHRGAPLWGVEEFVCWVPLRMRLTGLVTCGANTGFIFRWQLPTTTHHYQSIYSVYQNICARHSQKKLYQFNIQCVTKVFVQYIQKKISHQKWYLSLLLLNLKIKTSLVLYYRAGSLRFPAIIKGIFNL